MIRQGVARFERPDEALSVSAVNRLARELIEGGLPPLWVAGEVSGWRRYASGHCYFGLKDADAQIRCVMFSSDARRLPADPEEGMAVRVLGGLTLYEKRGEFQLRARRLEAAGEDGLWRLAFERLKSKLDEEGLLSAARKRPLPRCPVTIGIVTSPLGAVLHDILHVIERRAPWTRVVLSPTRVQGEGAAGEIAAAIRLFARAPVDLLIVARGGGSIEDLWPFNEEPVARALADARVPVISAVGHETDVTIADLVADLRAPTPSAAAELAVPDGDTIRRNLDACGERLRAALERRVERPRRRLDHLAQRLGATSRA
ncbi:MAG: exodeoxyribonuclease VII large subunit, partial [Longimicrobiales bacterium]